MGRKGGLSTMDKSGEERAQEEAIDIDESKFRTGNNQDKNQNFLNGINWQQKIL